MSITHSIRLAPKPSSIPSIHAKACGTGRPSTRRAGRAPHANSAGAACGFTLLELMMTIAIVAIFAGIGVPSFTRTIANHRVHAAGSDLQTALWRTRSEAIRLNRDVTLQPASSETGWEGGWVALPAGATETLLSGDALKGVTLSGGPASVVYRASGRARSGTATFEIASKQDRDAPKRCLRIDPSGQPMLSDGGC
ncbi:GspH/FimT family pseudopilin [Thiocapsa sp.]|uniref:GspH/FimT family pseudopilin n=1 Tax=Thiocapsa sp. TaxID=2024551 RepID=UPI001BCF5236|nr:GspH/FimT family pseudopilin [Thiocapsa sp.]